MEFVRPPRRRKTALERREQRLRSETRIVGKLLGGVAQLRQHRGSAPSRLMGAIDDALRSCRITPDTTKTPANGTDAPSKNRPDTSSDSVPSPASTLPSVLARRVPRVASCLEEHGPDKSPDSVPVPASTLPSVLARKVPRMASCLEENGPDTSSSNSVPSPASTLPSVLAGSGSYLAAAPKRNSATFVPGACSHPNVAKVDEFVDRLVRSSTTTPTAPTLALQKKVRSSDDAALLELMDLFDNPDTWSDSVTKPELQIDFSRITNPEVEDALRSGLHDIAGKAHDVQNKMRKIQNSYLEVRKGCAMLLSDASLTLGDTDRSTRISEVLTLLKGLDQGRREYKWAAEKWTANYDQLMVIALRAYVD